MGVKVALIGTHGTGKTTLMNRVLTDYRKFDKMSDAFSDAGAMFKDKLLEILDKNNLQLYFYARHLYRVSINDDFISDRSVLDALCYAKYENRKGNLSNTMMNFLEDKSFELLNQYDYLFWLRPEFELVGEDKRPVDKEYQLAIDNIFQEYIQSKDINIIRLSGTVEERYNIIKNILDKHN
jgi:deoxyadenosine/deoxycytidine kinase